MYGNCTICGSGLQPLFTSTYCSNDNCGQHINELFAPCIDLSDSYYEKHAFRHGTGLFEDFKAAINYIHGLSASFPQTSPLTIYSVYKATLLPEYPNLIVKRDLENKICWFEKPLTVQLDLVFTL